MNDWNAFRDSHRGEGLTMSEMSKLYQDRNGPDYCSPDRKENFVKTGTCMVDDEFKQILSIKGKLVKNASSNDLRKHAIKEFEGECGSYEACMADETGIGKNAFVPKRKDSWSYNTNAWLSNKDINSALEMYERREQARFGFLGVYPIDFDVSGWSGLPVNPFLLDQEYMFDEAEKKGIVNISVVFNISRHDQPGQHWVCCHACIDPESPMYGVHYFDSIGKNPAKSVQTFMTNVQSIATRRTGKNMPLYLNNPKVQYGTSECGMFCINVIRKGLHSYETKNPEGHKFAFLNPSISDKDVFLDRYIVFRPVSKEDFEKTSDKFKTPGVATWGR